MVTRFLLLAVLILVISMAAYADVPPACNQATSQPAQSQPSLTNNSATQPSSGSGANFMQPPPGFISAMSMPAAGTSADQATLVKAVGLLNSGNQTAAVELLLQVDWSHARSENLPRIFTLTEKEFNSLPEADRHSLADEQFQQFGAWRALARAAVEQGRQARTVKKYDDAERHYMAALNLGLLINRKPDNMIVARLVGIAIQDLALAELVPLYQQTNQPEKLQARQEQQSDLRKQLEQIRKVASGK